MHIETCHKLPRILISSSTQFNSSFSCKTSNSHWDNIFHTANLENYTKKVHFKYFQCLTALNWRWAFGLDWTWWRPINFLGSGYPILVALGIASMSELQQTSSLCKKGIKCKMKKKYIYNIYVLLIWLNFRRYFQFRSFFKKLTKLVSVNMFTNWGIVKLLC